MGLSSDGQRANDTQEIRAASADALRAGGAASARGAKSRWRVPSALAVFSVSGGPHLHFLDLNDSTAIAELRGKVEALRVDGRRR